MFKKLTNKYKRGFTPLEFLKNFFRAKHNNKKTLTGFTLIELLVVIAIIGLLATIVMVSLNTARSKGADAAIKANLTNIVTQAELAYDTASPNSYAAICADTQIVKMLASANTSNGDGAAPTCANSAGAWAVSSPLKSSGSWCVDSAGANKAGALTGTTDYDCP